MQGDNFSPTHPSPALWGPPGSTEGQPAPRKTSPGVPAGHAACTQHTASSGRVSGVPRPGRVGGHCAGAKPGLGPSLCESSSTGPRSSHRVPWGARSEGRRRKRGWRRDRIWPKSHRHQAGWSGVSPDANPSRFSIKKTRWVSGCADGSRAGEHWDLRGSQRGQRHLGPRPMAMQKMGSTTLRCRRQRRSEVPVPKDLATGRQDSACPPRARRLSPPMGQVPIGALPAASGLLSPSAWVRYLALTSKEGVKVRAAQLGALGWPVLGVSAGGMDGMGSVMSTVPRHERGSWPGTAWGGGDGVGLTSYTWKKRVEVSIGGEKQNKSRLNHVSRSELPGTGKGLPGRGVRPPALPESVWAEGRCGEKTREQACRTRAGKLSEGLEKSHPTRQDTNPWWLQAPHQCCSQGTEGTNTTMPR